MKRWIPLLVLILGAAWLAAALRSPANHTDFDLEAFSRLPVLVNGRIKPLDTVARTSLLVLQGRQRVSDPTNPVPFVASPAEWLAEAMFRPAKTDDFPTFRLSATDSAELLTLMGLTEDKTRIKYDSAILRILVIADFVPGTRTRFSYNQLQPKLADLDQQAQLAQPVDPQARTPFQKAVIQLRDRIMLYQRIKHSVQPPDSPDFLRELIQFQKDMPAGVAAFRARQKGETYDETAFKTLLAAAERFDAMGQLGYLRSIPPAASDQDPTHWRTAGHAILEGFATAELDPNVVAYAAMGKAWRDGDAKQFNEIVHIYRDQLAKRYATELRKSDIEARFNSSEPFYKSMVLYALAFFVAVVSWLKWPELLGRSAFYLVLLAFLTASAGIATRMWLEGRPPVTNLYSSALFVGWGAVGLCLILERIYRNAIGSVAAGVIGFITLLIAHHLSLEGDTLEMMRAVLDTNLWLATHVVVVTAGYASTFLAGNLALIYILRGTLTRSLDRGTADSLSRMVYGIVCFSTLFSFVGTILGGIWADQSWGRFWGWDPKENGALIIVLWNALALHARWGGMVKQRGFMMLAVFGNIVTSWSWFGTNMLGVGLHSYGFMDAAFWWLMVYVVSQLAIMALALVPNAKWRSAPALAARAP
jgi:ABC-type transport system involved in cytochrome c biogenesis permease subunit